MAYLKSYVMNEEDGMKVIYYLDATELPVAH